MYIASQGKMNFAFAIWSKLNKDTSSRRIIAKSIVCLSYQTGPKPRTVEDFWKMIWQENVFVIAMVTNLKEGDKVCYESWI